MIFAHIVLVVHALVKFNYVYFIQAQEEEDLPIAVAVEKSGAATLPPRKDVQQRIALIDVSFTDGTKRICTGAIIHDVAVLTAGHCFLTVGHSHILPEMTTTFVVVGTRQMFESGYEQYLPIERIVTHPDLSGWRADLAIVHTFASMVVDNVGAVLPMATEGIASTVETNVTIFSWGTMENTDYYSTSKKPYGKEKPRYDSGEILPKFEEKEETSSPDRFHPLLSDDDDDDDEDFSKPKSKHGTTHRAKRMKKRPHKAFESRGATKRILMKGRYKEVNSFEEELEDTEKPQELYRYPVPVYHSRSETKSKLKSRYLAKAKKPQVGNFSKTISVIHETPEKSPGNNSKRCAKHETTARVKFFGIWRRQLGGKPANKLTVEKFTLVNSLTCKRVIEKVHGGVEINSKEIICFISEMHYVTESDIGAPAVLRGHLVGITVGSFVHESDHIAVAVKVSHYCDWILENILPLNPNFVCVSKDPLRAGSIENLNPLRSKRKRKRLL
ncbi:uncharacterized protein LOC142976595 isoform X2 [Anticarsia gemmatalis]|uniref:uncharacterized protein LOC142976595 isoform X2 n=1 Tax=Anticarsia gemmatalis TaxID=129554 RepID=UPI003F7634E2